MKTMSLIGGIKTYSFYNQQNRYKSEVSPLGRKVIFLNQNGRDKELEEAAKHFHKNQLLTIKEIYVGGSSSEVEFMELPDERFNTVMFADLETEDGVVEDDDFWI